MPSIFLRCLKRGKWNFIPFPFIKDDGKSSDYKPLADNFRWRSNYQFGNIVSKRFFYQQSNFLIWLIFEENRNETQSDDFSFISITGCAKKWAPLSSAAKSPFETPTRIIFCDTSATWDPEFKSSIFQAWNEFRFISM